MKNNQKKRKRFISKRSFIFLKVTQKIKVMPSSLRGMIKFQKFFRKMKKKTSKNSHSVNLKLSEKKVFKAPINNKQLLPISHSIFFAEHFQQINDTNI